MSAREEILRRVRDATTDVTTSAGATPREPLTGSGAVGADGLRDAVRTVLDDAAYADRARAVQVSAGGVVDPVAVTHRIVGAPVG